MMENIYSMAAIVVLSYFVVLFIIGQIVKDNSIVDIGWGVGFVVVTLILGIAVGPLGSRALVASSLVYLWGIRLAFYLWRRNLGRGEDYRYVAMRERWGNQLVWLKAFLNVYLLQAVVLYTVGLSIIAVLGDAQGAIGILGGIGSVVWGVGFIFEVVGDEQLRTFKKAGKNKGKIMTSGLWRYTRHPNYFGEAMMWWGIFLIAMETGAYFTMISPLIMTIFLRYISGVTLLEKKYSGNEAFENYKKETAVFVPWFPKKGVK